MHKVNYLLKVAVKKGVNFADFDCWLFTRIEEFDCQVSYRSYLQCCDEYMQRFSSFHLITYHISSCILTFKQFVALIHIMAVCGNKTASYVIEHCNITY